MDLLLLIQQKTLQSLPVCVDRLEVWGHGTALKGCPDFRMQ
jgi:hypothetical protein